MKRMKKSKGKKKFKGAVSRNAQKQNKSKSFGHLNLPKGISVFKEDPKSRISLDIMPYVVTCPNHLDKDEEYETAVPGELWYKRPYYLHRNIGTENETIVCPGTVKKKCPICEHRAQMLKEGAEWDDDGVKALKASLRNLYVVIPKSNKNYEEKPHIWDISQFLFQLKLNEEIQESEEYETFPDLEDGLTLRIRFSEETIGKNKFADTSRIDFKERTKPYKESILNDIPALDDVVEIPSYKAIEALFFGGISAPDVDNDDDEGEIEEEDLKVMDDEPEDDDDDDDDDDEEPEKEPLKRGKKEKSKCPHGHEFGNECEEHDDCDECGVWEACLDASEA